LDAHDVPVDAANALLEAAALRGLAPTTVRTYAFSLRHAWRWMKKKRLTLDRLTDIHLLDFIRFLRQPENVKLALAPRSVNLALVVIQRCYTLHTGHGLPGSAVEPAARFRRRWDPLSPCRKPGRKPRMTVPQRLPVPLERKEVTRFFESLRTCRDLAIASLMLFCGLRSCEVLGLKADDINFDDDTLRVRGKGRKERVLPMTPEVREGLRIYLRLERPKSPHRFLFLVLKGPTRGGPLSLAGLRAVFRYHRKRVGVAAANPHRFRHTFAVDMVRAGISLPTLMRLMGHTNIEMTLRYVNLSAEDVRQEFLAAVRKRASAVHGE
jgi:integrase